MDYTENTVDLGKRRSSRRVSFAGTCKVAEFVDRAALHLDSDSNDALGRHRDDYTAPTPAGIHSLMSAPLQLEQHEPGALGFTSEKEVPMKDGSIVDPTANTTSLTHRLSAGSNDNSRPVSSSDPSSIYIPQRQFSPKKGIYDMTERSDYATLVNTQMNKYSGCVVSTSATGGPASNHAVTSHVVGNQPAMRRQSEYKPDWQNETTMVFSESQMDRTMASNQTQVFPDAMMDITQGVGGINDSTVALSTPHDMTLDQSRMDFTQGVGKIMPNRTFGGDYGNKTLGEEDMCMTECIGGTLRDTMFGSVSAGKAKVTTKPLQASENILVNRTYQGDGRAMNKTLGGAEMDFTQGIGKILTGSVGTGMDTTQINVTERENVVGGQKCLTRASTQDNRRKQTMNRTLAGGDMEMTQGIGQILPNMTLQGNLANKTLGGADMDFTCGIGSILPESRRDKGLPSVGFSENFGDETLGDSPMDFTGGVGKILTNVNPADLVASHRMDESHMEMTVGLGKILPNETIRKNHNRTMGCAQMEMTEGIGKILANATAAVGNSATSSTDFGKHAGDFVVGQKPKTEYDLAGEMTMDFTRCVGSKPEVFNTMNQTTHFNDNKMDFTECIGGLKSDADLTSCIKTRPARLNKTVMFDDGTEAEMEFTQCVPYDKIIATLDENSAAQTFEKTQPRKALSAKTLSTSEISSVDTKTRENHVEINTTPDSEVYNSPPAKIDSYAFLSKLTGKNWSIQDPVTTPSGAKVSMSYSPAECTKVSNRFNLDSCVTTPIDSRSFVKRLMGNMNLHTSAHMKDDGEIDVPPKPPDFDAVEPCDEKMGNEDQLAKTSSVDTTTKAVSSDTSTNMAQDCHMYSSPPAKIDSYAFLSKLTGKNWSFQNPVTTPSGAEVSMSYTPAECEKVSNKLNLDTCVTTPIGNRSSVKRLMGNMNLHTSTQLKEDENVDVQPQPLDFDVAEGDIRCDVTNKTMSADLESHPDDSVRFDKSESVRDLEIVNSDLSDVRKFGDASTNNDALLLDSQTVISENHCANVQTDLVKSVDATNDAASETLMDQTCLDTSSKIKHGISHIGMDIGPLITDECDVDLFSTSTSFMNSSLPHSPLPSLPSLPRKRSFSATTPPQTDSEIAAKQPRLSSDPQDFPELSDSKSVLIECKEAESTSGLNETRGDQCGTSRMDQFNNVSYSSLFTQSLLTDASYVTETSASSIEELLSHFGVNLVCPRRGRRSSFFPNTCDDEQSVSSTLMLPLQESQTNLFTWANTCMEKNIQSMRETNNELGAALLQDPPLLLQSKPNFCCLHCVVCIQAEAKQALCQLDSQASRAAQSAFREKKVKRLGLQLNAWQNEVETAEKISEDLKEHSDKIGALKDTLKQACEDVKRRVEEIKLTTAHRRQTRLTRKEGHKQKLQEAKVAVEESRSKLHDLQHREREAQEELSLLMTASTEDLALNARYNTTAAQVSRMERWMWCSVVHWRRHEAVLSLLRGSLLITVTFSEELTGQRLPFGLPEQTINSVHITANLPDTEERALLELSHHLLHQTADLTSIQHSTTSSHLFKSLQPLSYVVNRVSRFIDDIELVKVRHLVQINKHSVGVKFSSLKAHVRFTLTFDLTHAMTSHLLPWMLHSTLGIIKREELMKLWSEDQPSLDKLWSSVQAVDAYLEGRPALVNADDPQSLAQYISATKTQH